MKPSLVALTLVLTGSVSLCYADFSMQQPPAHPQSFDDMDADGSGYLTLDEVADDPFLSDKFSELDSDSDGSLSKDELKMPEPSAAGGSGQRPPSFQSLDTDGDGELSQQEVADDRFLADMFERMDRDGSGTLSEDEMRPPRR